MVLGHYLSIHTGGLLQPHPATWNSFGQGCRKALVVMSLQMQALQQSSIGS